MTSRAQLYNIMKTDRSLRNLTKKHHQKDSNSPTLSSSYSEKKLWAKTYKNQPFPKDPKKILIGRKFKLSDFSDQEQENSGVVMEQEENEVLEKKKVLPHFTVMSDRGEFMAGRSRIKSERKGNRPSSLSKSVESLKLPQVMEEKKQEEIDMQKLQRSKSKLSQFKDRNQFNQKGSRVSDNNSATDHSRDSLQATHFSSTMPEKIIENEAEQKKSDKVRRDRTMVCTQMQKLIVDQVDEKKWKKQESQQQIQQIIEEQKQQQEPDNINKLRISLEKIELETELLCKFKEQELRVSSNRSDSLSGDDTPKKQKKRMKSPTGQNTINENIHHE